MESSNWIYLEDLGGYISGPELSELCDYNDDKIEQLFERMIIKGWTQGMTSDGVDEYWGPDLEIKLEDKNW